MQLVPYEEVGRVFSLFGIGGDLAFIITNAIYSNIYRATVHWMPGFLFLFIAMVQFIAGLFMLWVHFQSAKEGIGKPSAIEQRQRRISQQLKRDSKAKLVSGCQHRWGHGELSNSDMRGRFGGEQNAQSKKN